MKNPLSAYRPESGNRRLPSVGALTRHPALRTTVLIAGGGISLMLANLIYAKILDPADYGRLILVQAVAFVCAGLLPLGVDNLIVRKEIGAPLRTAGLVVAGAAVIAALVGWLSHAAFGASAEFLWIVLCAGVAGAATRLFAAIDQSELRFMRSQAVSQAPFVLFLAVATMHYFTGLSSWRGAGFALIASYAAAAGAGYISTRLARDVAARPPGSRGLWTSALAFLGIFASLLFLNQMERLMAGALLGMAQTGALGLATTLIASPFRLLSAGVGYTLMPRLKHCHDRAERRRLLLHEFLLALAIGVPGAVLLLAVIPPLIVRLYGDKYDVAWSLLLALAVLGLIRLNSGVVSAAMNALGNARTLHTFNAAGWIATAAAAGAAFALSGFGSTGIVVGVAAGWGLRIAFAAWLIRKAL